MPRLPVGHLAELHESMRGQIDRHGETNDWRSPGIRENVRYRRHRAPMQAFRVDPFPAQYPESTGACRGAPHHIGGPPEEQYVSVFDYWSFEERVVRISKPSNDDTLASPTAGGWTIEQGEMELPFLPWTIVEGGTGLATALDHKVRPILGPLVHTEQWELMSLVQSMAFYEVPA